MKRLSLNLWLVSLLFFSFSVMANGSKVDYSKIVDTRIGTEGSGLGCGFTFIGASYPFGMMQFTPSFFSPQKGIVVNQMSGAGCPHLGNFPVLPLNGELKKSPDDMNCYARYDSVLASEAGFLSLKMKKNILCHTTVSKRSGIAQFVFPDEEQKGTVIIGSGVSSTFLTNAFVRITSSSSCEGYAEGGEFCGYQTDYRIFFVAEFDRDAIEVGTWNQNKLVRGRKQVGGSKSGAYFTFDTRQGKLVEYKIAISYVSIDNARENLLKDNGGRDFKTVRTDTREEWNKHLGKFVIKSDNQDRVKQFYTHWYHTLIHPNIFNDINGEYLGADYQVHKVPTQKEHYTTFSAWDTYRTQSQLLAMLYPAESADMMQSAIDFAEQSGGFGRWVTTNIETGVMHGDPMPIIIANTYAFGGRDFDVEVAFRHMKKGATVPYVFSQNVEVRPGLKNYIKKGIENASLCLEYTSADYAIGQFARQALGNEQEAEFFIRRADNWKNLYDPSTNWLRSRNTNDLSWKNPDHDWREATKENYFWMVPYDLETLINTMGGKYAASARLDTLFVRLDAGYDDHHFAAGNEPDFQVPWIYNWTDKPYKTSEVIHRIVDEMYTSKPNGLPGNDDCGSMGAWYVFASLGLFPMVPGVAEFSINAPLFESIRVQLPKGELIIEGGSPSKSYMTSMKLNGKKHAFPSLSWEEISKGAVLEFNLSDKPNKRWGL